MRLELMTGRRRVYLRVTLDTVRFSQAAWLALTGLWLPFFRALMRKFTLRVALS